MVLPGRRRERSPAAHQADWLLWQIADSAFPAGGFAHSSGLEAAWQQGEVRGGVELAGFSLESLRQCGAGSVPFVLAAHRDPGRLSELDRQCDCFLANHVANRASRLQGRAWWSSARRIFGQAPLAGLGQAEPSLLPCYHLAPVFGAVLRSLGTESETASRLFVFLHLRNLIASAVRLGIVGPLEAQAVQHRLGPALEEVVTRCRRLAAEEVAQTAPLIDLWQGTQDRLYSRLFQS
ncbi:MAG: urease accessory protein UreF [Verrucomicrobia bacterium]|nr:urease accessory protein UreF [Verrucomicrobiota bacterium]